MNECKQITTANIHAKQLRIKELRSTRIQTHVLMRVKFPKSLFSHRQEVWSNISTSRWLSLRTRRPHNARACVIHHGAHFYPHIHHRRRARGEPAQLHGTPCVITQCPGPHRQPARANYGLALTRSSAESPTPPPPHHPHPSRCRSVAWVTGRARCGWSRKANSLFIRLSCDIAVITCFWEMPVWVSSRLGVGIKQEAATLTLPAQ